MTAFAYSHYRHLLEQFHEQCYRFADFQNVGDLLSRGEKFVLLRHDIDMDLSKALQMARIEAESGATATYFFLVRTEHYNLFSRDGSDCVRRILGLGHRLGLHFECAAFEPAGGIESDAAEIAAHVRREAQVLGDWFARPVEVVSFHRPSPMVLTGDAVLAQPLLHTYMKCFTEKVHYVSDSRGSFRYGHPLDSTAFQQGRPMQLLTHPIWWSSEGSAPQESLRQLIVRHQDRFQRSLAENCQVEVGERLERAA